MQVCIYDCTEETMAVGGWLWQALGNAIFITRCSSKAYWGRLAERRGKFFCYSFAIEETIQIRYKILNFVFNFLVIDIFLVLWLHILQSHVTNLKSFGNPHAPTCCRKEISIFNPTCAFYEFIISADFQNLISSSLLS